MTAIQGNTSDWITVFPTAHVGSRLDDETQRIGVALHVGLNVCLAHQCRCGVSVQSDGLHPLADFPDTPRSTTSSKDHWTALAFTPFSNRSVSIGATAEDQLERRLFPSKVARHWPGMPLVQTRSQPSTYAPPFCTQVQRHAWPRT